MITVEYAEEARFFPQRVILRTASINAMFYTSIELDDPPYGRFWTLTPDGDVHPETLLAPAATGLVWLDGRHRPILAGHRLVRVYGVGAPPEVSVWSVFVDLESEVTCERYKTPGLPESPTPAATSVTSPGRRIASELEELGPNRVPLEKRAGAPPAGGQKK